MGSWANQHGPDVGGASGGNANGQHARYQVSSADQRELLRLRLENYRASYSIAPNGWRMMFQVLIEETERLL